MPSNMSCYYTQDQVRNQTKDVTRRLGWRNLKVGTILNLVEKAQGLKKGEKVKVICQVRVTAVNRELLWYVETYPHGEEEMAREGFPDLSAEQFVEMFCKHMKCTPDTEVTRIEFEYLERLCPFCGETDLEVLWTVGLDSNNKYIHCVWCGARGPSIMIHGGNHATAVKAAWQAWNKRIGDKR